MTLLVNFQQFFENLVSRDSMKHTRKTNNMDKLERQEEWVINSRRMKKPFALLWNDIFYFYWWLKKILDMFLINSIIYIHNFVQYCWKWLNIRKLSWKANNLVGIIVSAGRGDYYTGNKVHICYKWILTEFTKISLYNKQWNYF